MARLQGLPVPQSVEESEPPLLLGRCALTTLVSATNMLACFSEMWRKTTTVLDAVSFLSAPASSYVHKYKLFQMGKEGETATPVTLDGENTLKRSLTYQNGATVELVRNHLATPGSALQVSVTAGVNPGGTNVTSADFVAHAIAKDNKRVESEFGVPHETAAWVTCHCGGKPCRGNLGLRFSGSRREWMVERLCARFLEKTGQAVEPRSTPEERAQGGANTHVYHDFDNEQLGPLYFAIEQARRRDRVILPCSAAPVTRRHVSRPPLTHPSRFGDPPSLPLQECVACNDPRYRPCFTKPVQGRAALSPADDKITIRHFQLLVLVLRELFGDVPIAVVGFNVLRRAVSLVAYDPRARRVQFTLTRVLVWATVNSSAAQVAQMVQRFCGMLVEYLRDKQVAEVEVLGPECLYAMIEGARGSNALMRGRPRAELQAFFHRVKQVDDPEVKLLLFDREVLYRAPGTEVQQDVKRMLRCLAKPLGANCNKQLHAYAHLVDARDRVFLHPDVNAWAGRRAGGLPPHQRETILRVARVLREAGEGAELTWSQIKERLGDDLCSRPNTKGVVRTHQYVWDQMFRTLYLTEEQLLVPEQKGSRFMHVYAERLGVAVAHRPAAMERRHGETTLKFQPLPPAEEEEVRASLPCLSLPRRSPSSEQAVVIRLLIEDLLTAVVPPTPR